MNEVNRTSLFSASTGFHGKQLDTLDAGDIRRPGRSVYGFATAAARLAAHQPLLLHCREDELFDLLARLNTLLARPDALDRAYALLNRLQAQTRQKLVRHLELEQQPMSQSEAEKLVTELEQALAQPAPQTVDARLEAILSPQTPGHEIAGLKTMLARMQVFVPALAAVKDNGFHVVVQDKRRQPAHPALEARRGQPVQLDGEPATFPAGFLFPPKYHLTLWTYLIVRSDHGQSAVWN